MLLVRPKMKLKVGFRLLNRVMETLPHSPPKQKDGLSQHSTFGRKYFGNFLFQIRRHIESVPGISIPQVPMVSSEVLGDFRENYLLFQVLYLI